MKKITAFEWLVLALAAVVLLLMGSWFAVGRVGPANAWRVEVERDGSASTSISAGHEEWTDGLLESEIIDLNTAGAADLGRLPGIGKSRAQAIVEYRQEHGPFETVDELTRVSGIGPGILEQLRPYVTVG